MGGCLSGSRSEVDACDVRASTSLPSRAAEQRSLSFFVVLCACVASVSLSVCLVLSALLLSWPRAGDVPMFPCSTARLFPLRLLILMMTHAFARATHFVVVAVVVVCLLGYVVIPAPCLSFFLSFCCSCSCCCFCYCPSIPAVRCFLPPHAAHCCSIFLCHLF